MLKHQIPYRKELLYESNPRSAFVISRPFRMLLRIALLNIKVICLILLIRHFLFYLIHVFLHECHGVVARKFLFRRCYAYSWRDASFFATVASRHVKEVAQY